MKKGGVQCPNGGHYVKNAGVSHHSLTSACVIEPHFNKTDKQPTWDICSPRTGKIMKKTKRTPEQRQAMKFAYWNKWAGTKPAEVLRTKRS